MCNEGELLEKFNIQLTPIPMPELTDEMKKAKAEGIEVAKVVQYCRDHMEICIKDNELENVAALKVAMKNLIQKYGCQAAAIQCWNQLQSEIGIMPCAANSLLNEEGIPVVCETDIHGAITALLVEAFSLTGPSAIRILKMANSFSTAARGRSLLQRRRRNLPTRWRSATREASPQKQNTGK